MPGSSREFVCTLSPAPGDEERVSAKARKILGWACDGDPRIQCHGVDGQLYGVVQLRLTIQGRDQWATRQLAQDIVNLVTWGLANPAKMDMLSSRHAPHDRRGYSHGRIKRWREAQSSSST